ncbi:cupin domain-containing protein [Mucilaginibacter sp.]|uniref:cupin domain-containing protein n=1 Tax=Mucilaginibacter sp. TaxID=1882438 RepID=UPI0035BBD015
MEIPELTLIDITRQAADNSTYANIPVAQVNDHVVRMSVMTEDYFWHLHPDSDETFLIIEGSVFIDLEDRTVELMPNQLFTIPKNIKHRTRPGGSRSVNLTFESATLTTICVEDPCKNF